MISLFYGLPGQGKTTAMHDYVRVHANTHRFFVVDRVGEWLPGARAQHNNGIGGLFWRGERPPIRPIRTVDDFPVDEDGQLYFPPTGIYSFVGWEGVDVASWAVAVGDTTYVDDEIDFTAEPGGWKSNPLRDVCHRGRHLENANGDMCQVHILGGARRPQNLASDLTQLADEAYIFCCQGDLTLDRLERDSMIRKEERLEVETLEKFHFLHWSKGMGLNEKPRLLVEPLR